MACFIVPAVEAIAATAVKKTMDKENKEVNSEVKYSLKTEFTKRINWLTNMLWGGSALLAFEHLWHGEIVPYFPFLTAASNPKDAIEMLMEMSTVGVSMAALVTLVWTGMVIASHKLRMADTKSVQRKVK